VSTLETVAFVKGVPSLEGVSILKKLKSWRFLKRDLESFKGKFSSANARWTVMVSETARELALQSEVRKKMDGLRNFMVIPFCYSLGC
jgi:hypothetical protein